MLGVDPETGHEIVARDGRYGPYVTELLPPPPDSPDDDSGSGAKSQSPPVRSLAPDRCSAPWICRR